MVLFYLLTIFFGGCCDGVFLGGFIWRDYCEFGLDWDDVRGATARQELAASQFHYPRDQSEISAHAGLLDNDMGRYRRGRPD